MQLCHVTQTAKKQEVSFIYAGTRRGKRRAETVEVRLCFCVYTLCLIITYYSDGRLETELFPGRLSLSCLFPSHGLASASPPSPARRKMALLTATFRQHADEVACCAFSPSLLATSSGDKTIRVYSTVDFSELPYSPLGGHGYGVHCCCFSSCGSHLVSCSTDGSVMVRSAETGEISSVLQHPSRSPLRACALAPDSSLLLAGACDGTVALWEFTSNTLRRYSEFSRAANFLSITLKSVSKKLFT